MSVIDTIIPTQAFELIRDRIGELLADEMINQYQLSYNESIYIEGVYIDRFVPFDKTELSAINVTLSRGLLEGQTAIRSDGSYTYNIDVYAGAKTSDTEDGDSLAMIKLHRIIGMCRAILEDSRYKTLGFTAPFIMNRHVEEISFADPNAQDAGSSVMGRITFMVRVTEQDGVLTPNLISGYETSVKLSTTDKGYIFSESA